MTESLSQVYGLDFNMEDINKICVSNLNYRPIWTNGDSLDILTIKIRDYKINNLLNN